MTDGLYYRDDTTFVICSNGYPHEQPCPPGTKTSGSPRYQPGYYYGYTDLCSVNLVDYGYGPEYYAPRGYPYLSPDHRERGGGGPARPHPGRSVSGGGYGAESRPVAPSGGAPSSYSGRSSSAGESYPEHSIGSPSVRESTYGIGSPSKVRRQEQKCNFSRDVASIFGLRRGVKPRSISPSLSSSLSPSPTPSLAIVFLLFPSPSLFFPHPFPRGFQFLP